MYFDTQKLNTLSRNVCERKFFISQMFSRFFCDDLKVWKVKIFSSFSRSHGQSWNDENKKIILQIEICSNVSSEDLFMKKNCHHFAIAKREILWSRHRRTGNRKLKSMKHFYTNWKSCKFYVHRKVCLKISQCLIMINWAVNVLLTWPKTRLDLTREQVSLTRVGDSQDLILLNSNLIN